MHYTGTIWRPPYEASSLLLEVTAGCTHNSCKFCTLYKDLPFKFRMSPMEDIEEDLQEASHAFKSWGHRNVERAFLTGANPFVLKFDKLINIAEKIYEYIPSIKTIGCFSRVTDITTKTDNELIALSEAGYDDITIGIETGDDEALKFMHKGYTAEDIIKQCIHYRFFYLTGISGAGRGEVGAKLTEEVCNQLHPLEVGASMITIFPDSELYQEIQNGDWTEESELEKYKEVRALIENLNIPTIFGALGASNAFQLEGVLPQDKNRLLANLDKIIENVSEQDLRQYRTTLHHL